MGTAEGLIAHVDHVIAYFNARKLDLPDGFFDRKTQFVLNGAPFETLLSAAPNDPLVLMLARGPAGYRFTAKALQHAIPDAKIERHSPPEPDSSTRFALRLSGSLRGTGEEIDSVIDVALRMTDAGLVDVAEATVKPHDLDRIRQARLRP